MKNGPRRLVAVCALLVLLAVVGADGRCTEGSAEGAPLPDLGQPSSIHQHPSTGSSIADDSINGERQRSGTRGNPRPQHAWSTSSSSSGNSVARSRGPAEPISLAPAAALTAAGGDKSPLGRKGQPAGEQEQAPSGSSRKGPGVLHPSRRRLQQSALCPEGCAPGMCVPGGVDPALGFKCQQCLNNLMVDKATGKCACSAGRYSRNPNSCTDCPKGSYCDGGVYAAGSPNNEPAALPCGSNMTTLGLRSTSVRSCVNLPGNFYTISPSGVPGASICPLDTYGPGLRKQRACVPCPPNYVTNGKVGAVSPMQCVIPPGYYLKSPGVIAPCPMGEWKDGTGPAGNCTKCAVGVTTPSEASGSAAACSVLLPGYYAAAKAGSEITASGFCPQKFYCPGGTPGTPVFNASDPSSLNPTEPTIKACPSQSWTQARGSISPEQCLTPPGHFTAGGVTAICPDGSFRADWVAPIQVGSCEACGDNVQGDKSDRITVWDPVTGASSLLPVQTTAGDCYIEPGQGLFYASLTQTYRARNCEINSYGARTRFYGLVPYPCRPCPTGLVTSNDTALYPISSLWWRDNGAGRRGFISEAACVTPPGWGYSSRLANPCGVGFYNPRDTYAACTACPLGRTTAGVGAGSTLADCGLAAGYGAYGDAVVQCPQGTYNEAAYTAGTTAECTDCPDRTTTAGVGASAEAQCDQCVAGYGEANCLTPCGGGIGALATYGPAGRDKDAPCTACAASTTGYSFLVGGSNELFAPAATAPAEASSPHQCFSEYAQLADAWWLPTVANAGGSLITVGTGGTFADCVTACGSNGNCEYLTYDYAAPRTCYVREARVTGQAGAPHVGFKAVPSSDVGRSWSLSVRQHNTTKAKSASAGQYTWWRDDWFAEIGTQTAPPGVSAFTTIQDCLDACDDAGFNCAGVVLRPATDPLFTPKTCLLISSDTTLGLTMRSMTRTVVTRLTLPDIV